MTGRGFATIIAAAVLAATVVPPAALGAQGPAGDRTGLPACLRADPCPCGVPVTRITAAGHRLGSAETVYRVVTLTVCVRLRAVAAWPGEPPRSR